MTSNYFIPGAVYRFEIETVGNDDRDQLAELLTSNGFSFVCTEV